MMLHPICLVSFTFLLSFLGRSMIHSYPSDRPNSVVERFSRRDTFKWISSGDGPQLYCDYDGYFNPDRWAESEAGPAYLNWSMSVNKSSKAWLERTSEPSFFLEDVLGWSEMDCGVTYKGCLRMPTCDDILTKTQDKEVARQIYFINLSVNNIVLISGVVTEQSIPAQMNVASMAGNMAHTFFWKHSDSMEAQCKMEINILKGLLNALVQATLILAPIAGSGIKLTEAAMEAIAIAETSEATALRAGIAAEELAAAEASAVARQGEAEAALVAEKAAGVSRSAEQEAADALAEQRMTVKEAHEAAEKARINSLIAMQDAAKAGRVATARGYPKTVGAPWSHSFVKHNGMKAYSKISSDKAGAFSFGFAGFPMMIAGTDTETKYCAQFPNPAKEDEHRHELTLDKNIERAGIQFRSHIQTDIAEIIKGVGFGDNGNFFPMGISVLADQLYGGEFVQLSANDHLRFVDEPAQVEKDITSYFKNSVISSILKDQMCFLYCTRAHGKTSEHSKIAHSRFEPEPGTMCQTQCWRNWKSGKDVEMYGLSDLAKPDNDWDMGIEDFIAGSFKHWQDHRFNQSAENLFPTVGELLAGTATTSSGSHLPVCYSDAVIPKNYKHHSHSQDLPCLCGNTSGNETQLFHQEAGFGNWVANQNGEGLARTCQANLSRQRAPPVQTYLSLCHNGWHWPVLNDGSQAPDLLKGKDEQCDAVQAEVSAMLGRGESDEHVNCYMCFTSPLHTVIHKHQMNYIVVDAYRNDYYGFREACNQYNKDHGCLF